MAEMWLGGQQWLRPEPDGPQRLILEEIRLARQIYPCHRSSRLPIAGRCRPRSGKVDTRARPRAAESRSGV